MAEARSYLLAAGQGSRAGGPKAWAPYASATLLAKQLDFLGGVVRPSNTFVSIQAAWLERCRALSPEAHWVSVDPEATALASLQSLILASGAGVWGFVHHVDMPVWEEGLFCELLSKVHAAEAEGAEAVLPVFEGRGGHPVLLSPRALALLAELDPAKDRLDLWLKKRPALKVEVPYACVRENWNRGVPLP